MTAAITDPRRLDELVLDGQKYPDMAGPGENVVLTPEVQGRIDDLMRAHGIDPKSEIKAKYKLEIMFNDARSNTHPFPGMMFAWENGNMWEGGGDAKIYFCPQKLDRLDGVGQRTCWTPIDSRFIGPKQAICPVCRRISAPIDLCGEIFANSTSQNWAYLIQHAFEALEHNADIRLGILANDLRQASKDEQERDHRGDKLTGIRLKRKWVIYPLKNIIRDTAGGSDVYTRIRAFLGA